MPDLPSGRGSLPWSLVDLHSHKKTYGGVYHVQTSNACTYEQDANVLLYVLVALLVG